MKYYGFAGQILHVDLTSGKIEKESLDLDLIKKYIGSLGINYKLAFDLIKPSKDPLSPDSPILVGTGALCGTLVPGCGKCAATMKFPLPAGKKEPKYGVDTAIGGSRRFGAMLKYAGYDHVIITGQAPKPSYLKIIDDGIEICDASDIWGKDTYQVTDELVGRHKGVSGGCGVWVIGKAGETQVKWATALVDKGGTMGRNGGGAIMGSKNLKAVVTLGTKGIRVADPKSFSNLVGEKRRQIIAHPLFNGPNPMEYAGTISKEYPADLQVKLRVVRNACMACLGPEYWLYEIKDGRFAGHTMQDWSFRGVRDYGSLLRLSDYGEMLEFVSTINRLGLDLFTAIRMVYFVTSLFHRGVISQKDTGGLELHLGEFDGYVALLQKVVNREDIGEAMSEGWCALSKRVGVDASEDFIGGTAITKGADHIADMRRVPVAPNTLPMVLRPHGKHVHQGSHYAPCEDLYKDTAWPDREHRTFYDVKRDFEQTMAPSQAEIERIFSERYFNTGRLTKHAEDALAVYNAAGVCDITPYRCWDPLRSLSVIADFYSAATGISFTPAELKIRGEAIWNMERLLNAREGFSREDDLFSGVEVQNVGTPIQIRSGNRYLQDWFGRCLSENDLRQMLDDYYDERGWDIKTGLPTTSKLVSLGLEELMS